MANKNLTTRINLKKKKDEEEEIAPVKTTTKKSTTEDIAPVKKTTKKEIDAPVKQTTGVQNKNVSVKSNKPTTIKSTETLTKPVTVYSIKNGNVTTTTKKTAATKTKEEKEKEIDFYSNAAKTIPSTIGDFGTNVAKGFLTTVEGTVDTARYLLSDAFDLVGLGKAANYVRENAQMDVTGKLLGTAEDYYNKNSKLGTFGESVAQGIGNVGAFVGLSNIGGVVGGEGSALASATSSKTASFLNSFSSAYGNTRSEAYANGADDSTARTAGLINGFAEAISEQFFDAIPGLTVEGWGSNLVGKIGSSVQKYFGTTTGKAVVKVLNASGEGFEEIISNMLTSTGNDIAHALNKNYTYGMENQTGNVLKDLKQAVTSSDSWEAFFSAMLTSAITNGGTKVISNAQKNQIINAYAKENNISTDQANQLFNSIKEEGINSSINEQTNLGEQMEIEDNVTRNIVNTLQQEYKQGNTNALVDAATQTALKQNQMNTIRNNSNISSEGLNLNDSYRAYSNSKTGTKEVQDIEQMYKNRNANARYDGSKFINKDGSIVTNANGYIETDNEGNRTVILNPYANQKDVLGFATTHELAHDIKSQNTTDGNNLYNDVLNEIKNDPDYEPNRQKYEKNYEQVYEGKSDFSERIDEEMVADYLAERLGNAEYTERLISNQPKLAKFIRNKINEYKQNKNVDANGNIINQNTYLKSLEDRFEKAYNNKDYSNIGKNSDAKYSLNKKMIKYTNKEEENISSNKISIVHNTNEIQKFVEQEKHTLTGNKKIYYGKVNNDVSNYVKKKFNINIENYNISLRGDNIRKIFKDHGNVENEQARGQIAITNTDFNYIDDIVSEPDNIELSDRLYDGKPVLIFSKNINGKYELVEIVSNGKMALEVQTMYRHKKKNSVNAGNTYKSLPLTSKTDIDTSSNNRILSQNGQNVNEDVDNASFNLQKEIAPIRKDIQKTSDLNAYIEDVASRETQQNQLNKESAKQLFRDYLEENDITNPTKEDIDNAIIDTLEYDNDLDSSETKKMKKIYYEAANEVIDELNANVKYSLSDNDINSKINQTMTMQEAEDMIERAFKLNDIYNWYDGKYKNGIEWFNGEGIDDVTQYLDNTYQIQDKYLNKIYEKDLGYGEDFTTEDILEAYQNKTLTGTEKTKPIRLDTSFSNDYTDNKFYAPKDIEGTKELYDKANTRVTNNNREEVYKARADFIIAVHNPNTIESLGLNENEVNKKLRDWSLYSQKTKELSQKLNENVSTQNQWFGLENSSLVNNAVISNEQMEKLVKEVVGDSSGWQRQYITGTMLALDTHIDYSNLTFEFEAGQKMSENAAGQYFSNEETIRIKTAGQNTVAHEIGHYLDHKWAEELGFKDRYLSDKYLKLDGLNEQQKQFVSNFKLFIEDIENSSYLGSNYSNNNEYWQRSNEVFARFVGKFVEWTKNQATNGRYTYENKFYDDKFTYSQYNEFVKLLQEKSMLDTKYAKKYGVYNQEIIDLIDSFNSNQRQELINIINNQENVPSYQTTEKIQEVIGKDNYFKLGKTKIEELVKNNFYQNNEDIRYSLSKDYFKNRNKANIFQETMSNNDSYFTAQDEPTSTIDNSLLKRTTNKVSDDLQLNKKQTKELQNIISQAYDNELSTNEIEQLLNKFALQTYSEVNQDVIEQKKVIREIPLKVSDGIKTDIADYNTFRKQHMGKLNIKNTGIPVDVAYQSLVEQGVVPADITNPTDQLLKLAEIVDQASEMEETYEIPLEKLQSEAEYIHNSIIEDMFNVQTSGQARLNEQITRNDTPEIAPVKYMPESSVKEYIDSRDIAPIRQDVVDKQMRKQRNKEKNQAATSWFMRAAINQNAVIDNLADKTGNRDLKYATDMFNSVSGEASTNITGNQTDNNGNTIGKGVNEIFAPAKKAGLYNAFNDYLIQKSNIERNALGKGSQIPIEVSKELVSQYEKEHPEFKTWAKDVYKYNDNVLQNEVDAGLITEEQYKFFRGENGVYRSYVPFYEQQIETSRYYDNDGKIKPVNTLKRAKGGASQILAVEDSMIRQTYAYKSAIRQNQRNVELVKTLGDGKTDNIGIDIREDNITDMNKTIYDVGDGTYQIAAYVNGEQITAPITEEMYNELNRTRDNMVADVEDKLSGILKPIQAVSKVRRNLITSWNPIFAIRNAIKDIQDAAFNSKYSAKMLKNYPKAYVELIKGTKEAKQFMALYGSDNLYGDYSDTKSKVVNKLKSVNEIIELAPRYAEFKATLESGGTVNEAMYNAREVTTNFGRGGYITKALNRNGFTFLNASVQGLDKQIRNIKGQNGVKGYAQLATKAVMLGVIPAIFNHLCFGSGDDKDEDYEALPDYIKDNYYLIKIGDSETNSYDENGLIVQEGSSKFLRIPKGRILSVLGSAARRTLETIESEEDAFEGYLDNAWDQIGVGDIDNNNIFAPIKQAFFSGENGEAWYGGDIVPSRLQDLPAGEQTDSSIDAISNWLGEKLNISPYKINYLLDQYSGGIGDVLLPMMTEESTNGASGVGYLTAPLKDAFVVDSTNDNKYASEFYDLKDTLEKNSNSKYATDEDVVINKYMSSVSSELSELYAEKREVQSNSSLTKEEKYKKATAIQNQINETIKDALDTYENGDYTDNYSKIGDIEYYKNSENEWTKVRDSEAEETAGLTSLEKSEYFKTKVELSNISEKYSTLSKINKDLDYSSKKKTEITNSILNSNNSDETKALLYSKYYSSEDKINNVLNSGFKFENYIKYTSGIESVRETYSQDNGYTTSQRKQQVVSYVNKLNLSIAQKAMLIKSYYSSFDDYNTEIVNYVSSLSITRAEKVAILEDYDMKVDENGNVTW